MFGAFAGLSLGLTATKHVAEFRRIDPLRAGRVMALSGIVAFGSAALVATVCFVLAPWLSAHVLAAPGLANLLRIRFSNSLLGGDDRGNKRALWPASKPSRPSRV